MLDLSKCVLPMDRLKGWLDKAKEMMAQICSLCNVCSTRGRCESTASSLLRFFPERQPFLSAAPFSPPPLPPSLTLHHQHHQRLDIRTDRQSPVIWHVSHQSTFTKAHVRTFVIAQVNILKIMIECTPENWISCQTPRQSRVDFRSINP